MTLSPTISRWSSRVFFSVLLHLSHAYLLPLSKQTKKLLHLDFFYFFCSAFPASNSLQILVRSYLSSELRWQVFSLRWTRSHRSDAFGPTESSWYNRTIQLGVIDFTTGKTSCHLFLHSFWSSSTQWILSSTSITFLIIALCCDSRIKPIHDKFQRERERLHLYQALLGNWCQRGRERSHQSLSFRERDHISEGEREDPSRGERDLQGERILVESISQGSQMLGVQEERCHMSYWGERHVHMCLFALALFIYIFQLWFSVPYLLPVSHVRFRGSKTSKGKKSFKFIAYLYSWVHV